MEYGVSDLLTEWWLFAKGLLCRTKRQNKEAAILFTECLESMPRFDPVIRKSCLYELENIFYEQGLDTSDISHFLSSRLEFLKDIIFVVEYTYNMKGNRLRRTFKMIMRIISHLHLNDRFALVTSSRYLDIRFRPTSRSSNYSYIVNLMNSLNEPIGLHSSLYDSLAASIKLLAHNEQQASTLLPFDEAQPEAAREK